MSRVYAQCPSCDRMIRQLKLVESLESETVRIKRVSYDSNRIPPLMIIDDEKPTEINKELKCISYRCPICDFIFPINSEEEANKFLIGERATNYIVVVRYDGESSLFIVKSYSIEIARKLTLDSLSLTDEMLHRDENSYTDVFILDDIIKSDSMKFKNIYRFE